MIRIQNFNFNIWKLLQMSRLFCNVLKISGGTNAPPPGCAPDITLAELPSKFIGQTLVLTCSLRVESLHTLFVCSVCRSTWVSTGTSNKQILSTMSRMWWSQSRRHGGMVVTDPKTMLEAPPSWNMKHCKSVEFCQFLQCQAPVHKPKPSLSKAFWWRFWVERRYTAQHKNWARLTTLDNNYRKFIVHLNKIIVC